MDFISAPDKSLNFLAVELLSGMRWTVECGGIMVAAIHLGGRDVPGRGEMRYLRRLLRRIFTGAVVFT